MMEEADRHGLQTYGDQSNMASAASPALSGPAEHSRNWSACVRRVGPGLAFSSATALMRCDKFEFSHRGHEPSRCYIRCDGR